MKSIIRLAICLLVIATAALPYAAFAQISTSYTSGIQVQNLDPAIAHITLTFYNQDGTIAAAPTDTIPANGQKTYFPLSAVPGGFNGSAVISSDTRVGSIVNTLTTDLKGQASYTAFTNGATTVNLPLVMKNAFNISTFFNVQNAGGSDAHITITYANVATPETATIKTGASNTFYQQNNTNIPNDYVGAASITSDQPIVAVVMERMTTANSLLAYEGFTTASTNPVIGFVSSNFYYSGTGIQIQNTGGSSTNVTVTYYPSTGFPGFSCTQSKTIAAHSSETFAYTQLPAACGQKTGYAGITDAVNGAFVGSAKVTGNTTSQPLDVIVNAVTRTSANSAAYNAISPADATANVSLPLVADRVTLGPGRTLFTGISIYNAGSLATTVNCTFSGTSYTISKSLNSGETYTDPINGKIAVNYVGSALCAATGGDAKIGAIVTELTLGEPTVNDVLLEYNGINY